MSVKIEQIVDSGVTFQESLRLPKRFEPTHSSFSNTGGLMGKLCSIVGIPLCVVAGTWDQ
jgi:hypothetical protein